MKDVNQESKFLVSNIDINDLKFHVKCVEMQKLKAIVSIDFGDFTIKGFRVNFSNYKNEDGDELWITPPCYRDGNNRYHPIFYIPNKDLWGLLQKKIVKEYNKASEEHFKKRLDVNDIEL